jgi:hypothetical protein
MKKKKRLWDTYRFPGYRPSSTIMGVFGDPQALVVKLERRGKKQYAAFVEPYTGATMTGRDAESGISPVETSASTWRWRSGGYGAGSARA